MPMDRKLYPPDWDRISRKIRERAGGRCECSGECGHDHAAEDAAATAPSSRCWAQDGGANPVTSRTVILTVAHLNHTPADCRDENLKAMCQRCHLSYDRPRHLAKARQNRRAQRATGDLFDSL